MLRGPTTWTEERIEKLKLLHKAGHSFGVIAMKLGGITRNAAIGKAQRLGLPNRGYGSVEQRVRLKCGPKKRRRVAKETPAPRVKKQIVLPTEPLPKEDIPKGPLVLFADLEAHHCRAPYGDPKEPGFGFCGCQKVPGSVYCADHMQRFYRAPEPRRPYTPGVPRQIDAVNSKVAPKEREDVFA